ncbi:DNA-binding transcriptional MerR regulator [Paenibacillus shirakamiensis]|uniref:DNA-binding transcriptional MerR regulator n=1 Tax=Paenibacillus shirakamiensis TaxID=1265935 RepID=A0ABS4JEH8_9BACL|nr:MerR family transcriptional regulator [Paenibacillus shirakamiensis]MBP2000120.1 DNA-binding transcriptional MerR regulator [Paenibacillus shirakamiensis]
MNTRMRIGELAERAGVTQRTVRHYESIGIMPPGEREGTGQHYYTEESLERLRKINQLKKLNLSLDEIREVVQLYFIDPSGVQSKRKALAVLHQHLAEANQKLSEMEQFRGELIALIEHFEQWLKQREL